MITTSKFPLSGFEHWKHLSISVGPTAFFPLEWFLLSILSIICTLIWLLLPRQRSNNKNSRALSSEAVRALSMVFTPSSGGRFAHLASYFRRTRSRTSTSNSQSIQLDLSEVLENIFAGNIELRHTEDLSDLLRERLYVYNLSFTLSVTRSWWFTAAKWIVLQQFHMSLVSGFTSYPWVRCGSQNFDHPSFTRSYNDLDHIPIRRIEFELLNIQRTHLSGATFSIEFTCFAPGVAFLSSCYILCLVPFLYASRGHQYRTHRFSVLALSLQKVIGLLNNRYASILTVTNISSKQAAVLCCRERDMVYNGNLRNRLISDEGLVGWRRERFMLLWEAGLLSAGLLFRWRIILKAN